MSSPVADDFDFINKRLKEIRDGKLEPAPTPEPEADTADIHNYRPPAVEDESCYDYGC